MKLSEAIRLGAMIRPQARGHFRGARRKYFGLFGPKVEATCALGAAYEAATGGRCRVVPNADDIAPFRGTKAAIGQPVTIMETPPEWPMFAWVACPDCVETAMPLRRLIPHLNDDHRWTREAIAALVERYEPREIVQCFDGHEQTVTVQELGVRIEVPTK